MIKILVISDTHGNMVDLSRLNEMMQESDYVFHLGDHYDDMRNYYFSLKDKIYRVHGNCDWGNQKDIVVNIGEHKIFATHGDLYSAKRTTEKLVKKVVCGDYVTIKNNLLRHNVMKLGLDIFGYLLEQKA